ncbi:hypothetical protein [Bacillus salipaludis]|uniref:Lipoprotein n=1 Tax=Bacillus salipaludis TaxID=2547811 RepID=A0AA90Z5E8_9BACI|nr:hypothetical protein [Bacillus salipaludis]MDQ6600893.1 hypothetical protein [Bacillus salipaludis]
MKKTALLIFVFMLIAFLVACNDNGNQFDTKGEQEKATNVMKGVLTSFKNEEKLAETGTSEEANQIAWKKIKEKNIKAISKELSKEDQKRLLYLLTTNKAEDLPNGGTQANLLFSQDTTIQKVSFHESSKTFTFDIERSGFDRKLVTLKQEESSWKIFKIENPK